MTKLHLIDVYHNYFNEPVDIICDSISSSHKLRYKLVESTSPIQFDDLHPDEIYRIFIDPPSYLPVSMFITAGQEYTLIFAVDPIKVQSVKFNDDLEIPQLPQSFNNYSDLQKAGLYNMLTKARHTILPSGKSVYDYLITTELIQADRIWCEYASGLLEEVDGNPSFTAVPYSLHSFEGEPPDESFKTDDYYGNLQLTFYATDTDKPVVELDIDDCSGLAHIFQVARNELTGRKTHPYDIHEILIAYQGIDPGYRLVV